MKTEEFDLEYVVNFRKKILTQYLFIQNTKKLSYLPSLMQFLNNGSNKAYLLLYYFLINASIINLFKTTHYFDNQKNITDFLKFELVTNFKIIKLFLITIIDCGACRLSKPARKIIFTKNYVAEYSFAHIRETLLYVKNNKCFFEHDLEKNSYDHSKICIDNFIECGEMLENASTIEEKVVAVSKVLNVWHCNGPFFYKNYSNNETLNNPTAPFTKKQFEELSNISLSKIENEIKKLI
jgi:hypothetical protein